MRLAWILIQIVPSESIQGKNIIIEKLYVFVMMGIIMFNRQYYAKYVMIYAKHTKTEVQTVWDIGLLGQGT